MWEYAGIHLLESPYFLDRAFDYFIPPDLRSSVAVGDFVTVPFGTANYRRIGLVTRLSEEPEQKGIGCKPILSLCDHSMSLSEEMLGLCFFLKEQTLCTVGDAVRAMIPASALSRLEELYLLEESCPTNPSALSSPPSDAALLLLELLRKKGALRKDLIKSRFGPATEGLLKELSSLGYEILSASADYLKAGGRMLYSTCTLTKEENEDNFYRFLDEHKDFEYVDFSLGDAVSERGCVTLLPNGKHDGFFIGLLRKKD